LNELRIKYFNIIILFVSLTIFLSGCGALLTALIQTLLSTSVGIVAIPAVIVAAGRETGDPIPGMILLPDGSEIPPGYKPAKGAKVIIVNSDGSIREGIADENGRFKIENVEVGIKQIKIEKEGYVSIEQSTVVSLPDEGTSFSNFRIVPDGTVILSLYKKIIERPQANFYFHSYGKDPNGNPFSPDVIWSVDDGNATIDSLGHFRTETFGTYTIKATSKFDSTKVAGVIIKVYELSIKVYGYVKDPSGNPIMDANVRVHNINLYTKTDVKGYYELSGVPLLEKLTVIAEKNGAMGLSTVPVANPDVPVEANIVIDPSVAVETPTPEPTVNVEMTPTPVLTVTPTPLPGKPAVTSITDASGDNYDNSESEVSVDFTINGANFGPDQIVVNGLVKFINTDTGNIIDAGVTSWSDGEIKGNVVIPAGIDGRGSYLIEVTVLDVKSESKVYYYKGSGSYNISIY
jgi:hypothetical protein